MEGCDLVAGARNARPRARAVDMQNKISTFGFKLKFFSADFYKGRVRLRGEIFFRSTGAGGREEA